MNSPGSEAEYPFAIPAFSHPRRLPLESPVTFFVGENGSGKSTLLEAVAVLCGFPAEGGTEHTPRDPDAPLPELARALQLSWAPKIRSGFFLRAESFFNFASYLDELQREDARALLSYGGRSLHQQSHGEAFLSLFQHRFESGIFLLDEPEAALSPQRQLALLALLHQLGSAGAGQFLIATHSPILISVPGSTVYQLDGEGIRPVPYDETGQFRLMKGFVNAPERYLGPLLAEDE